LCAAKDETASDAAGVRFTSFEQRATVTGAGHFVTFDQLAEFVRIVCEAAAASYDNHYALP